MKRYIIILLGLVPLLSMAQASDEVLRLIHKMEEQSPGHYRKGIINLGEGYYESDEWRVYYGKIEEKDAIKALKDSAESTFSKLAGRVTHSYQQCISQDGIDTIRYALAIDGGQAGKTPEFDTDRTCFYTKEAAHFNYLFDKENINSLNMAVELTKRDTTQRVTKALDMKPVKDIFETLARRSDAEKYEVEYVFNIGEEEMNLCLPYETVTEDSLGRQVLTNHGSNPKAKNGACRGTMLVFPAEKAGSIAKWTASRIYDYVTQHKDNYFLYGFSTEYKDISLDTDNLNDFTNDHFCTTLDDFGRLVMLYIDRIDSTFALPHNYEKMRSYNHGEVELLPSYVALDKAGTPRRNDTHIIFPWRTETLKSLGVGHIPVTRIEATGGKATQIIMTTEITSDADSVARLCQRLTSLNANNILRREVHLPHADTLEITFFHRNMYDTFKGRIANESFGKDGLFKERIAYKLYGKDGLYKGTVQYIQEKENDLLPLPADLRWIDELADSLKEKGVLEEHAVKYEYGDKKDPESCGEVTGRLYVSKAKDFKNAAPLIIMPLDKAVQTYTTEHKEETYHFITNMKENSTRYNDYHLFKRDNEAKRICLLIVDDVKGPYLLPEEWYKITRYKYGKKKYLK